MKLNERLETALDMLNRAAMSREKTGASWPQATKFARLFDVGCDHAYLSIEAVSRGLADHSFAMDVREGPIEIARENITRRRLLDRIETICTFGLDGVELEDGDAVTILGMGGHEISDIISRVKHWPRNTVLLMQPMKSIAELRQCLAENGLQIVEERLCIQRHKLYSFLRAETADGPVNLRRLEREIGAYWLESWSSDPLWPRLREQELRVATLRLNDPQEDHEALQEHIQQLERMS